jgi:ubiquitin carboxyl-terminal hydrolase 5/13
LYITGTEQLIRETMSALSSAHQSEVQAWEEEITACEHTLYVDQSGAGKVAANGMFSFLAIFYFLFPIPDSQLPTLDFNSRFEVPSAVSLDRRLTPPCLAGLAHCTSCTLKENLWLCLTCGSLGCGRAQYGAGNISGNGHGLKHYEDTKHPVSVKLGTISAEGAAGKTFPNSRGVTMSILTCTLEPL